MRKITLTSIILFTIAFALSFLNNVWCDTFHYETVGGEISQTSFLTTFLAPTLIVLAILGAILLLAYVRIKMRQKQ
jgi:4-hydroxybenzoate polyprenyltransferase